MDSIKYCEFHNRYFNTQLEFIDHLKSSAHPSNFFCIFHKKFFKRQIDLEKHLNSSAHPSEYFCTLHQRFFITQLELSQHLESPAHIRRQNESSDEEFICYIHNRHFRSVFDYNQHMNSLAHPQDDSSDEEFQCGLHNLTFKSKFDLNLHLNSPAHPNDETNSEEDYYQTDYEEEENFIENLPIPRSLSKASGQWIRREDFEKKSLSYGYFICEVCGNFWMSAKSQINNKKECEDCNSYLFPQYMWLKYIKRKQK